MKINNKMIMAALAAAALMVSGQAMAATSTANMTVSMTNVATASVSATPIAFGNVIAGQPADATGTITVNVTSGAPYTVSFDAGVNHLAPSFCRMMRGVSSTSVTDRTYDLYADAGHRVLWGDSDTANSCSGALNQGGASQAGTGTGANQVLTVYAHAHIGSRLGTMSDTVTVTVAY